jgi:hypothetical protein
MDSPFGDEHVLLSEPHKIILLCTGGSFSCQFLIRDLALLLNPTDCFIARGRSENNPSQLTFTVFQVFDTPVPSSPDPIMKGK